MADDPPEPRRSRTAALLLYVLGALVLAADVAIGFPSLVTVLSDPDSHAAQDAGMTAMFILIPMAVGGIACLLVAWLTWRTRAGGVALSTASATVVMVAANVGGIPLLVPAIGVAIVGVLTALWFLYRDWRAGAAG